MSGPWDCPIINRIQPVEILTASSFPSVEHIITGGLTSSPATVHLSWGLFSNHSCSLMNMICWYVWPCVFVHLYSCLQMDLDGPRPQFSDMSLPSSLGSPMAVTSEDFSIPGGQDSSQGSSKPASCPLSDPNPSNREQAFKTEFNLIYTCSPLNANLGNPVSIDRRLSRSEGAFSPAESFHSSFSSHGLLGDVGTGSMSPYSEAHYVGAYLDSGTPPHISNPPQKKKASYVWEWEGSVSLWNLCVICVDLCSDLMMCFFTVCKLNSPKHVCISEVMTQLWILPALPLLLFPDTFCQSLFHFSSKAEGQPANVYCADREATLPGYRCKKSLQACTKYGEYSPYNSIFRSVHVHIVSLHLYATSTPCCDSSAPLLPSLHSVLMQTFQFSYHFSLLCIKALSPSASGVTIHLQLNKSGF